MKKVIFVGGTRFSGSTFFHLMLANDPKGFACGEVIHLFRPQKPGHKKLVRKTNNESCQTLWKKIYENGEENLYETIFDLLPDVEFIVDSTKSPFWIRDQNVNLTGKGIEIGNILIWKTPLEFAHSLKKRGQLDDSWGKQWLNPHRRYFSLIEEWRAVKYADLVRDTNVLAAACQYLGIPYFPGKEEFWKKAHCYLGGNESARFHLYSHREAKKLLAETFDANRMHLHRQIFYSEIDNHQFEENVAQTINQSQLFEKVELILNHFDVCNSLQYIGTEEVKFSAIKIQLRRFKYEFLSRLNRYRFHTEFVT